MKNDFLELASLSLRHFAELHSELRSKIQDALDLDGDFQEQSIYQSARVRLLQELDAAISTGRTAALRLADAALDDDVLESARRALSHLTGTLHETSRLCEGLSFLEEPCIADIVTELQGLEAGLKVSVAGAARAPAVLRRRVAICRRRLRKVCEAITSRFELPPTGATLRLLRDCAKLGRALEPYCDL